MNNPPSRTEFDDVRIELRLIESEFLAWRRASAALLARLRCLLPPEAEAAVAEEFASMLGEADASEDPLETDRYFTATEMLRPDCE